MATGDTPIVEELQNGLRPEDLFELFRHEDQCFFLDSSMDPSKLGRYSLMGGSPFLVFSSRGETISLRQDSGTTCISGNPWDMLGCYLEMYHLEGRSELPTTGGAVGYLSYDLGRFIERLPVKSADDIRLPECCLGFYDLLLVFDNLTGRSFIISSGLPEKEGPSRARKAGERLAEFRFRLSNFLKTGPPPAAGGCQPLGTPVKGNFSRDEYIGAVEKARQYIIEGDIFEVNLSQRFEAEITISPWELYRRLRRINPAPFSAFLNFTETAIVSSSPERFLRCRGDRVETRPIKGTIRRGKTTEEDEANTRRLLESEKDRAENMMIVDLERNDLGRVCRYGSVRVTELAILEKYPTVYHLTSTVTGRLREGVTRADLLKATFPGGSITGAPKIRAMEIIEELEPTRRSVYTGSLGYIGFDGNLDLNIVIRTFLVKGNRAYFQMGGAVVYDSDPEAEYRETLDKGEALFRALR
ncbi:MAG: aminodeoxychorismate synthase component I [Dehalococcoidales bacterium]|nr:aminodeoxychorismate synthase component I [Dehalococcoidales bacterium]